MLGLFGTLNLGTRSLQTQRVGIEVAGHNMANANNPAYSRQRVTIQTSVPIDSGAGPQGTGADISRIVRIHNDLIDTQITSESSITGALTSQQRALQYAQANLGQQIDTRSSGAEGTAASQGTGTQHGISEALSDFFATAQSLSSQPSSITERDLLLKSAALLAEKFNQTDSRLAQIADSLDHSMATDAEDANRLLDEIAKLNDEVVRSEALTDGTANDIRDTRQQKLEQLAALVKIDTVEIGAGAVNVSISGVLMVDGDKKVDGLRAAKDGDGRTVLESALGASLDITGGSLHGTAQARDVELKALRDGLNQLATALIGEVNAVHAGGYGLDGSSGEDLFTGTGAANMAVNQKLVDSPALLQVSKEKGATGDGSGAVGIAQLERKSLDSLNRQTFSQHYAESVAGLGQSLSTINQKLTDQTVVQTMLSKQRDSVSGVSLDEEMTDLVKYQKAFQASARLISTVDEMLDAVISMKR